MTSNIYDVGDVVCTVKDLRNDGTYPDPAVSIGDVIVEAGTIGEVINVGLYLQEHIVYAVAFRNGKVVGALERELALPADDEDGPSVYSIEAATAPTGTATVSPASAGDPGDPAKTVPAKADSASAGSAKGEPVQAATATPESVQSEAAKGEKVPAEVELATVQAAGHGDGHGGGHGEGGGHGGGCKHGSSTCKKESGTAVGAAAGGKGESS
ncbi:Protein NifZ [Frankia sp. AiPs1]|uniref:nitrogen fixation protein NifZ n=1 Tax=Frankia sp. AiPa1 TaxID=573492 RepID=UPI00202AEB30|nr:nitrogen fixation protein NifZ [Frankia sp. AiPa1]MCL9759159.1 nitrogen fixation protein NifZ [Frankia sp. AiPa1]